MRDTSENKGNPKTSRDRLKNKASKNRKGSSVNNLQQKETNTNSSTDIRSRKCRNAKGNKGKECDSETITVTADVHMEGSNDNNMAEIVDIVDKESGGNISEQNFLSVMNRFADEMSKMANSMSKMKDDLNQRMDSIANDIEKRLANKISNIVDKRVNAESSKMSKTMNKRIDDIRDDMNAEIESIQQRIDEIPSSVNESVEPQEKHLNICIRNHPQRERENVNDIVSDLLIDGLQLRDTGFKKAIRKGRDDRNSGVIIVTCKNIEDKTEIMRRKKQLRKNRRYERVYIHADQSLETRVNNNNMKTLLSALGVKGLRLKGSRLVTENDSEIDAQSQHSIERNTVHGDREERDAKDTSDRRGPNRSGRRNNSDYDRNYRRERNTGYSEWDRRENRYREQGPERGRYEEDSNRNRDRNDNNSRYTRENRDRYYTRYSR